MSEVRLIPLGVGDAFSALNYTTCLALGVDDDWLLIDCPHPVRKMLREGSTAAGLPLDLDRVLAVAISHLHADHCSGLEDYGFYSTTCSADARGSWPIRTSRRGSGTGCSPPAWSGSSTGRTSRRPPGRSTTTSTSSP